jgi:hypothetical protein
MLAILGTGPCFARVLISMSDSVSEDECTLCSGMWPSERDAFRANLDKVSLRDPVCDACLMAFFRNIGFPVSDEGNDSGRLS